MKLLRFAPSILCLVSLAALSACKPHNPAAASHIITVSPNVSGPTYQDGDVLTFSRSDGTVPPFDVYVTKGVCDEGQDDPTVAGAQKLPENSGVIECTLMGQSVETPFSYYVVFHFPSLAAAITPSSASAPLPPPPNDPRDGPFPAHVSSCNPCAGVDRRKKKKQQILMSPQAHASPAANGPPADQTIKVSCPAGSPAGSVPDISVQSKQNIQWTITDSPSDFTVTFADATFCPGASKFHTCPVATLPQIQNPYVYTVAVNNPGGACKVQGNAYLQP